MNNERAPIMSIPRAKMNRKLNLYSYENIKTARTNKFYIFQQQVIKILMDIYADRKIRHNHEGSAIKDFVYGDGSEHRLWMWANETKEFIKDQAVADKIANTELKQRSEKIKTNAPSETDIIIARNKKSMYRPFNIKRFNAPKEQAVNTISADRSEFSQYMYEPVHLLGKVVRMTKDYDARGILYTKILLVNVQYFPTNPRYLLKKALFLPDHIWIDVSNADLNARTYQINDYVAFSGIVGAYKSRINKYKSTIKDHQIDYWLTKYNIIDNEFQAEGQPVINEDGMIEELVFTKDPSKALRADDIPNPRV